MPVDENKPLVVLDTNCYIEFLLGEASSSNRAAKVKSVLEDNGKEIEIALPAIVRLELLSVGSKGENGRDGNVPKRRRDNYREVKRWLDSRELLLIDISERLLRHTERVIYDHGLKVPDALVLSSAEMFGAHKLYTFDSDLLHLNGRCEVAIEEPPEPNKLIFVD